MAELMRHDVLSEGREKEEVGGVLPSLPRARRRIGGPAEACDERGGRSEVSGEGASGESENCRPR